MLEVHRIDKLDEGLIAFANADLRQRMTGERRTVKQVLQSTHQMWLIKQEEPIGVFGVVNHSLITQSAYIWFIPFRGLKATHAKTLLPVFNLWACNYNYILAQCFDERAERFAEFFGFDKKNDSVYERRI